MKPLSVVWIIVQVIEPLTRGWFSWKAEVINTLRNFGVAVCVVLKGKTSVMPTNSTEEQR
jgi:hypothetical protein